MSHFDGHKLVSDWEVAADATDKHDGILRRWVLSAHEDWDWEDRYASAEEIRQVLAEQLEAVRRDRLPAWPLLSKDRDEPKQCA
jgi:hypothetical protein